MYVTGMFLEKRMKKQSARKSKIEI